MMLSDPLESPGLDATQGCLHVLRVHTGPFKSTPGRYPLLPLGTTGSYRNSIDLNEGSWKLLELH